MSNVSAKLGPYALTECLESGSSVQLWLGAFKDEQVAIRLVVDPTDDFAVSRWRGELEALQSINERMSLPKILAVFEDEKGFVLEWKGSESLEERISEALGGHPCSLEEAVAIGLSLLEALSEVGKVHGTLSPRQVRIDESSRVTLYGYGTQPERVQPRYMAPEMSGEGEIGLHTDQWHTAVMIYELALGRALYQGDWSEALRQALDGDNAEGLNALSSRAPALAEALLPALRFAGAMGYASHAEMGLALQGCLMAGEAVSGISVPLAVEEEDEPEDLDLQADEDEPEDLDLQADEDEPEDLDLQADEDTADVQSPVVSEAPQEPESVQEVPLGLPEAVKEKETASPAVEETPEDAGPSLELPVEPSPAPQLERIKISLPESLLPPSLEAEIASEASGGLGPLGQGISSWEEAAFSACEGADPVERGSWWVSRLSAQTELPANVMPQDESDSVQQPVPLPQPASLIQGAREQEVEGDDDWFLGEASNLVGSLSALIAEEEAASEEASSPESAAGASVLPEQDTPAEVQFNEPVEELLEPPVLDELPPVQAPEPAQVQLPPPSALELPGREAITELLAQESQESTPTEAPIKDLPWDQPDVVIPAPPKALEVAPPPVGTPDILSPRRPVKRNRMEGVSWDQAWAPRPLSERIARSGLLVLLGAGIAWMVMG